MHPMQTFTLAAIVANWNVRGVLCQCFDPAVFLYNHSRLQPLCSVVVTSCRPTCPRGLLGPPIVNCEVKVKLTSIQDQPVCVVIELRHIANVIVNGKCEQIY